MIRQYRHPLRKILLEFPAGHIENNEDAEKTATRELLEETGYHAREIEEVYTYNPSVNISKQLIHIFRGRNLVKGVVIVIPVLIVQRGYIGMYVLFVNYTYQYYISYR